MYCDLLFIRGLLLCAVRYNNSSGTKGFIQPLVAQVPRTWD